MFKKKKKKKKKNIKNAETFRVLYDRIVLTDDHFFSVSLPAFYTTTSVFEDTVMSKRRGLTMFVFIKKPTVHTQRLRLANLHLKSDTKQTWPRGYKSFFMLNSVEREILNAHKYKGIQKFEYYSAQISLECYFPAHKR